MTIFEEYLSTTDLTVKKSLINTHPKLLTEKNTDGRTLLHIATKEGVIEEVRLLLSKGAQVTSQDNDGRTPLHAAISANNEALVQLFLANSPEAINIPDSAKWTPLHLAALKGFDKIGYLLVIAGADVSAKADKGRTYDKFSRTTEFNAAVMKALSDLQSEELARQLGQEELSYAIAKLDSSVFYKVSEQFKADLPAIIGLCEDTDPC